MTDLHTDAHIAVLRERTEVLGREMRELKEQQTLQTAEFRLSQDKTNQKLDALLMKVTETRGQMSGGWQVVVVIASILMATVAGVAWVIDRADKVSIVREAR